MLTWPTFDKILLGIFKELMHNNIISESKKKYTNMTEWNFSHNKLMHFYTIFECWACHIFIYSTEQAILYKGASQWMLTWPTFDKILLGIFKELMHNNIIS